MSYATENRFHGRFVQQRHTERELEAATDRIEELECELDEAEKLLAHAEGLLAQIGILTRGYAPEREEKSDDIH